MAVGQICYKVLTVGQAPITIPADIDVTKEILRQVSATIITKLCVTGQPGLKLEINGNKEVMIGRTGVYEIDNVEITSLRIIQPIEPVIDKKATYDALTTDGYTKITTALAALKNFKLSVPEITPTEEDPVGDATVFSEIINKDSGLKELAADLSAGCNSYIQGYNGIYTQSGGNNREIYNIIIDYVYQ